MTTTMPPRAEVEADIRQTLGLVPTFFSEIPDDTLGYEWALFKRLELGETAIPGKYKELLMVAVHSETRCRFCLLFHTVAARLQGASEEEIQEAVHLAKHTVGWSAYVNGMQTDYERFAAELVQVERHLSNAG